MPIWVSDFVLRGFGTGAVVGVPGHDRRDFEFAQTFKLPVKRVVVAPDGDGTDIIVYHAYDKEKNGAPTLRIAPLSWGEDGWPTAR